MDDKNNRILYIIYLLNLCKKNKIDADSFIEMLSNINQNYKDFYIVINNYDTGFDLEKYDEFLDNSAINIIFNFTYSSISLSSKKKMYSERNENYQNEYIKKVYKINKEKL